MLVMVACDKDKKEGNDEKKPVEALSPDDSKKRLEEIAMELLSYPNPDDFDDMVGTILDVFVKAESGLPMPKEFMEALGDFVKDVNEMDFKEYLDPDNDIYCDYSKFLGTYTYNVGENDSSYWDYEKNEDALVFIIDDLSLSITPKGAISINEGRNEELPEETTFEIKNEDVTVLLAVFNFEEINYDKKIAKSSGNIELANIKLEIGQILSNKELSFGSKISYGGVLIADGKCNIEDFNIISEPSYSEPELKYASSDDDTDDIDSTIQIGKVEITLDLINQLFIKGTCKNVIDFVKGANHVGDEYEYGYYDLDGKYLGNSNDSIPTVDYICGWSPEVSIIETIKFFNEYFNITWGYGTYDDQGTIAIDYEYELEKYKDGQDGEGDEYDYDYNILPILIFNEDESEYSFVDFFTDEIFNDVVEEAKDLMTDYYRVFAPLIQGE